jgi:hypothetical protein
MPFFRGFPWKISDGIFEEPGFLGEPYGEIYLEPLDRTVMFSEVVPLLGAGSFVLAPSFRRRVRSGFRSMISPLKTISSNLSFLMVNSLTATAYFLPECSLLFFVGNLG